MDELGIVDDVLNIKGDIPDALYLKAQVLWEGFGRSVESKGLFRRVMQLSSAEDPLYRWSRDYIDRITEKDRMRIDEFRAGKDYSK